MSANRTAEEVLEEVRLAVAPWPTITRVTVDEYQLALSTAGITITSYVGWTLVDRSGASEHLDSDYRVRSTEAYRTARMVGHAIESISFDHGCALIVRLDSGDTLTLPKPNDFENFMIGIHGKPGYSGIFIF